MFQVIVPATTAYMGPGYDVLGMALKLYNRYTIEKASCEIEIDGLRETFLEENLLYQTIKKVLEKYRCPFPKIRIWTQTHIPMSRGLGSSAACIVAGLMIANRFLDGALSAEDMIQIGTQMEGHPDNVVPAIVGGMTASVYEAGQVIYSKVNVPKSLRFAIFIPDFSVSTSEAREVLPQKYKRHDCIFNIGRVAMLIEARNNGDTEKLRIAMEDRIHQPYRGMLIPQMEQIFDAAKNFGSKAEVISGSGSTLMAVIDEQNTDFEQAMIGVLKHLEGNWEIKVLEPDLKGARYCGK